MHGGEKLLRTLGEFMRDCMGDECLRVIAGEMVNLERRALSPSEISRGSTG